MGPDDPLPLRRADSAVGPLLNAGRLRRGGRPSAPTAARGGQRLGYTVDGDTWVFKLTAKPVKWEILPGTRVTAWTYNGTVPGPEIRVHYG